MTDELKQESDFARKYHEEKLLKRAKKKARKNLQTQGFGRKESSKMVKNALNRISSNKPERKAAGRGG